MYRGLLAIFFTLAICFTFAFAQIQVGLDRDPAGVGNASYHIGEGISVNVASRSDAYLYIFNLQANRQITQLVPSASDSDNFIHAGGVRSFPSNPAQYQYIVSGPVGVDTIVVLASPTPIDQYSLNQMLSMGQLGAQYHQATDTQQPSWHQAHVRFQVAQTRTEMQHTAGATPLHTNTVQKNAVHAALSTSTQQLSALQLRPPQQSHNFSPRLTKNSLDGSFESQASLQDMVNHFGSELVHNGFHYEGAQGGIPDTFQGIFSRGQLRIMLTVQKKWCLLPF